ncbi:endosialidase-like protein [Dyadobacter jiangsuensis]|uniref:Endosialidase-like protein n=2 Tax=Dyadobacter jiangsuensis TaxID=1591085 RepID=A0A2P8FLQ2_9BACT|nr:endosialidase-like protein [Dyadobacter jiangsuensis]
MHITLALAQAPQQFSFQGVAKKADGKVVSSAIIGVRLTIHSEAIGGTTVYQETHSTQTNPGGIFNIQIGGGNVVSGTFAAIPWKTFPHFLQLEMDPLGGSAYTDLGTTQMLSVPYAMQAKESTKWNDGYPVVQKFEFAPDIDPNDVNDPDIQKYYLPAVGDGHRLIWYPFKGALRVGESLNGKWEGSEIGAKSVAFGGDNLAKGDFSFAVGLGASATGLFSTAIGQSSSASGTSGVACGLGSLSKGYGTVSVGMYNASPDIPNPTSPLPTDIIFQVGYGSSQNDRKSGISMLRNGNLGIGNNVLAPEYLLDLGGRMRIRHNGTTSGIHFNNSQNIEHGFMGMKTDAQIGFFINNAWRFWVDNAGNGALGGTLSQSSDRRLKRDFSTLSSSLGKLAHLKGYHYYWKDKDRDQSLQTGLVAQEVEALFPELVKTDEKGFKSLNYTGLIPHLIESVKELAKQNAKLEVENAALRAESKSMNDKLATIVTRLDQLSSQRAETMAK